MHLSLSDASSCPGEPAKFRDMFVLKLGSALIRYKSKCFEMKCINMSIHFTGVLRNTVYVQHVICQYCTPDPDNNSRFAFG